MPEFPEVETVRRAMARHLVGRTVAGVEVRVPRLRAPVAAATLRRQLVRRRVEAVRRRGKYLLVDLSGSRVLLIHLGMTGHLALVAASRPRGPYDHVVLRLRGGDELRFSDPRRFGLVEVLHRAGEASHPRLARLGLEPLGPEFDGAWLWQHTRGVRQAIKPWLMDAHRVVGVGNIYASEALFGAGVDPRAPAGALSRVRCGRVATAVRGTLRRAIVQGGTTLRDFFSLGGEAGYFAVRLRVYDRAGESCRRCGARVRRVRQAGRSTYFCPGCQR